MRVNGEAFFLINGWMNFLSLLSSSRLMKIRFRPGKAAVSAAAGAFYSLAAYTGGPFMRSLMMLLITALFMSFLAFGSLGLKTAPMLLLSGWLFSGLSNYALSQGADSWITILLCSGTVCFLCFVLSSERKTTGSIRLVIMMGERKAEIDSLADSGNLLRETITGLPVIVAPERKMEPFLPPGIDPKDLSTLPFGWRLIQIRTAAGPKTLMYFFPDTIILRLGKKEKKVEAAVAISDFDEYRALVPASLCN